MLKMSLKIAEPQLKNAAKLFNYYTALSKGSNEDSVSLNVSKEQESFLHFPSVTNTKASDVDVGYKSYSKKPLIFFIGYRETGTGSRINGFRKYGTSLRIPGKKEGSYSQQRYLFLYQSSVCNCQKSMCKRFGGYFVALEIKAAAHFL
ncbi:hypothetical protein PHYBLDRAFT_171953 [Phycomyces blakesleeanus NRRL 1555(-)]|uniref:Uncharacterized protein n=1 Tax=Phycomyces blakesleeanus (strain ATCC 8743b / DSM 1359 / FGSC 10004 / NBRC 33097 / NRRL 1555) TaxID=763407 RepID=A0A163DAC0_PHYB8|nr:hypothetical protein PHYBLDRAFT_171953 [Phycomyces blakesleeanus NRRL 1555(-)]OAD69930.1 hypothetical protein PHYBLDRAFT_171953 [Phycomyces blakesleeanus NRRL 1555(-)]|eukprot:XP_018287970.1 hypothetical protein PHYBLDRAFT_171953 [Phycomyces blakesleeanus NRRL 1555(-)]